MANTMNNYHLELPPAPIRMKRQQATRACIHCKRLHAKCSNERPCQRCSQNGLGESCVDSPRKQRVSKVLLNALPNGGMAINEITKQMSIFSEPNKLVMTGLDGGGLTISELNPHYGHSHPHSHSHLPKLSENPYADASDVYMGKPNYKITYPSFEKTMLPPIYSENTPSYGRSSPVFNTVKLPSIYSPIPGSPVSPATSLSGSMSSTSLTTLSGLSGKMTPSLSGGSPKITTLRSSWSNDMDKLFIPTDEEGLYNSVSAPTSNHELDINHLATYAVDHVKTSVSSA